MIRADLQSLVSPHNQSSLPIILMLQKSHISSPTLLPLVGFLVELEELRAHLECLLFEFLIGLNFDLLSKTNDRFEMDIL